MPSWTEVIPDAILASLYSYLLIRIAASSDPYFKKPFYTFFMSTGLYSILSVVTFHPLVQFAYTEEHWTHYIYKISYSLNIFGANGATFGKAFMAIHRYFVLKNSDYAEKKFSKKLILGMLIGQFAFSALSIVPAIPASYLYNGKGYIYALDPMTVLIMKTFSTAMYVSYVICNGICMVLTSRKLFLLGGGREGNSEMRSIVLYQKNMFIIVTVCSVCHFLKALLQFTVIFSINIFNRPHVYQFTLTIYPVVNGIASYAAPVCLVMFSAKVRALLVPSALHFKLLPTVSVIDVTSTNARTN